MTDSAPTQPPAGEQPGQWIDRYRLVEPIGEGGMGTVWLAEQSEPVVRKVALKIIKLGMDTREVVVRFEAERQALALMDHPHIAKVLDGGATASGRPYFVMELVNGVPVTDYCSEAKLELRDRLALFIQVCDAIQHAHHKGVIHRDIKPSNVLVSVQNGVPVPKVIDFGIAKATNAELTQKTLYTQFAQILGTPEYMAPEQAQYSGLDIDTRADVYSLGVLLYELLTGTKPFELRDVLAKGFHELLRMIREVDPARPSTRVSTVTAASVSDSLATNKTHTVSWGHKLRGELDWIVMKALEKDRTRRYDTPNAFAADVERFLRDEPVFAAPPGKWYQFRKFVKRRKLAVVAVSLILLTLLGGIIGTTLGMLEAKRAAKAESEAKLDAERRRREAETNLGYARKGSEILESVFDRLDPKRNYETVAEFRSVLRDSLSEAVAALRGASIGDPLEVARVQCRLGQSLSSLGESKVAVELFTRAHETYLEKLGKDHDDTLSALQYLATCLVTSGDFQKGVPILEEVLEARKRLQSPAATLVASMMSVAEGYGSAGRDVDAEKLYGDALNILDVAHGIDERTTILCMGNLASVKSKLSKGDEALKLYDSALARAKKILGADNAETMSLLSSLALAYLQSGKTDLAIPMLEESLRTMRSKLGPDHPTTLSIMNNLASAYQSANRTANAAALLEEVLKVHEAKYGPEHPHTLLTASNLSAVYQQLGKNDVALPLIEKTVKYQKLKLGADHPNTLAAMGNLAAAYWRANRFELSIPMFEDLLRIQTEKLGRDHVVTKIVAANLMVNYRSAGRYSDALALVEEVREEAKTNPRVSGMLPDVLDVYLHFGMMEKASELFAQLIGELRKSARPESTKLAGGLAKYGQLLVDARAFVLAEPILRESLEIRLTASPESWSTFNSKALLGAAIAGQNRFAEAEPLMVEGAKGMEEREAAIPATAALRVSDSIRRLAEFYDAWEAADPGKGHAGKAKPWREKWMQRGKK